MKKKMIVWKSAYGSSTEYVEIREEDNISVNGHITGEEDGIPFHVHYLLQLDLHWVIQSVSIQLESKNAIGLYFEKKNGSWFSKEGKAFPALAGCIDIDLSLTPFTNTLPVRRLQLSEGATQEIRVLYFKLPEGSFRHMDQRYTNIDGRFYKYENVDGGYTTVLELDEDGMVIYYPGRWQRVFPAVG